VSDGLLRVLTLISALGCGLVGGIFFAFSAFVMKALNRLPPAQGIAAMQSINVTVINPLFMTAFFGTAAACAILTISSLLSWHRPGGAFLVVSTLSQQPRFEPFFIHNSFIHRYLYIFSVPSKYGHGTEGQRQSLAVNALRDRSKRLRRRYPGGQDAPVCSHLLFLGSVERGSTSLV